MTILTKYNLPINNKTINGTGSLSCTVTSGNVFITLIRNGTTTVNNQRYSVGQGFSSYLVTNIDSAAWQLSVNVDALGAFTITAP
jgi:hypothetical protein